MDLIRRKLDRLGHVILIDGFSKFKKSISEFKIRDIHSPRDQLMF